jgi:hypothetical protein
VGGLKEAVVTFFAVSGAVISLGPTAFAIPIPEEDLLLSLASLEVP